MRILYLTMAAVDETSGVYKKIRSQVDAFNQLGHECRILFVTDGENGHYLKNDVLKEIQFSNVLVIIEEYLKNCDFCYARFELLRHKKYKAVLDMCRKRKVKIIFEIPTFPPYQESIARVRGKLKDKYYLSALKTFVGAGLVVRDMNQLAKMSEMVVIIGDDYKFKGKKTIRIENGINLEKNPYASHKKKETINIIAVSNFAIWNGYDRAIEGMRNYKGNNVHLILVGPLDNAPELQKKVAEYGLEEQIEFTGALSGEALNEQYARADIALGALGNHRRKVFANSSLKAKEYAARGMLMVLSDAEGIEREILEKSYVVKSDESPLNIDSIVDWYNGEENIEAWKKAIHNFAVENYSWEKQMQIVLSAFMSEGK